MLDSGSKLHVLKHLHACVFVCVCVRKGEVDFVDKSKGKINVAHTPSTPSLEIRHS